MSPTTGRASDAGVYVWLALFLLAAVVARHNLRFGRGDREGARKVAALFLVLSLAGPLRDPRLLEPSQVWLWVSGTLFMMVAFWLCYLALEPLVRRRWPDTLVSWTRLLRGRVRDPLVGRDILLGVLGGILLALMNQARPFGAEMSWPGPPAEFASVLHTVADRVDDFGFGIFLSLAVLMVFALLRQVLRRTWAAALGILVLFQLLTLGQDVALWGHTVLLLFIGVILGLLVWRGLLAVAVALSVDGFLGQTLMTTHLGAWYANSAVSGILATLALGVWGFHASLGGRPFFGDASQGTR